MQKPVPPVGVYPAAFEHNDATVRDGAESLGDHRAGRSSTDAT
jgi:hypothetical protein